MNNKLFVGNLSFRTSEAEIIEVFSQFGAVLEVHVMLDRITGRPRGFAFVTMSTDEEAEAAIKGMNGVTLEGRNLTVNVARPREERTVRR
jgi:RNA recognition motif-containing protein